MTKEGATGLLKFPSEVDKFIKTKVVGDAIKLMCKKKYKNDRSQIESHGCWHRISPSGDEEDYQTFSKAKFLYEKLLNKKYTPMTLTAFSKLSKISVLKQRVTRVSLDLMYKRITQNANTSIMDLQTFFDAMEDLSNVIFPGQLGKLDALIDLVLDNIGDIKPT